MCLDSFHDIGDTSSGFWGRAGRLEEVSELLSFLVGVGWIPGDVCWRTFEEIGDEDLIFVGVVGGGEDVGALDGLGEVAEDVVDVEEGFACVGRTGNIWRIKAVSMCIAIEYLGRRNTSLEVSDLGVVAFLLVAA